MEVLIHKAGPLQSGQGLIAGKPSVPEWPSSEGQLGPESCQEQIGNFYERFG